VRAETIECHYLWRPTPDHLGPRPTLSAYTGFYDFRNADSVALARPSSKNPQTPLSGALPLTSGNPVQNSTYTTTATNGVTITGTAYPTGVTSVTNAQFASRFGLFDTIARLDVDSGHPRVPLSLIGDYVQNTEACGNLPAIVPPPSHTSALRFKQTVNAPATRINAADIGPKEQSGAWKRRVTCSWDMPASTSNERRSWATSITASFARGQTSRSTALRVSTNWTRAYNWVSLLWLGVRSGLLSLGSHACSSMQSTSSKPEAWTFHGPAACAKEGEVDVMLTVSSAVSRASSARAGTIKSPGTIPARKLLDLVRLLPEGEIKFRPFQASRQLGRREIN
jgi:hypothetical protein